MLIKEYRVILPISVEEYQVGQLYSVAEASKNETGGGEGVEVLKNEPYEKDGEKGQYTHKIYHLQSKVPSFVRMLAPASALNIHEKAWNAYPYCRTGTYTHTHTHTTYSQPCKVMTVFLSITHIQQVQPWFVLLEAAKYSNCVVWKCSLVGLILFCVCLYVPLRFSSSGSAVITNEYMKDNFLIKIETWHKPDSGHQENVHGLDAETWKKVDVVYIDIADRTQVEPKDYKPEEDPCRFKSAKTGRGPLGPDWKKELPNKKDCPHMCAYKLVTVKFKWWGLQNKVESFIQKQEKRLFTNFHRQLFCWIDKWIELNMDDIRRMEEQTRKELDEMRVKDPVKGMVALED
ncbi:phosphatidylinositol transfer protein alpha isoform [Odontesthes bonariensis]